jgi:poly-gamma-glutamate synthesis protein (capsule biosynthesis protein)
LGDFVLQLGTIEPMPDEMYERFGLGNDSQAGQLYDTRFKGDTVGFPSNSVWYESVVAVPVFRGHQLIAMKLYPIDIGHKLPRPQRGTPRLAEGALAEKIIDRLATLSEPFGTRIELENGIGVWRSDSSTTTNDDRE